MIDYYIKLTKITVNFPRNLTFYYLNITDILQLFSNITNNNIILLATLCGSARVRI